MIAVKDKEAERWITQTNTTADPDWFSKGLIPGNCQQAALASLLKLKLEDVPHFAAAAPEEGVPEGWSLFRDVRIWLRTNHDIDYAWCGDSNVFKVIQADAAIYTEPYGIALGATVRGDSLHAVVWNLATWELVHDPHPDRTGINKVSQIEWLTPFYDPDPHTQLQEWLTFANQETP